MPVVLTTFILLPFLASVALYVIGRRHKAAAEYICIALCLVLMGLGIYAAFFAAETEVTLFAGFRLTCAHFHGFYTLLCTILWTGSAVLNPWYFKSSRATNRYLCFSMLTLGATCGMFLAADFLSSFVFFEIASFSTYFWFVQEDTQDAKNSGRTYLVIEIFGGIVMLIGLILLYNAAGTFVFEEIGARLAVEGNKAVKVIIAICFLLGFGAKAGMFPLHSWLPMAHPAPAPASALLSGTQIKTGLYGILIMTVYILPGIRPYAYTLLVLGCATMLWGAVKALCSTNIKETLASSSMSQIGFILLGVAVYSFGNEAGTLAANGIVLYMMNHMFVKLVLFACAGILYGQKHTLQLNGLKGAGRGQPLLLASFLVAGMSLSGIPGTLGYLAKTLIHECLSEQASIEGAFFRIPEILFVVCGGLTLAYMLKLFVVLFVEKERMKADRRRMNAPIGITLVIPTLVLFLPGILTFFSEDFEKHMTPLLGRPALDTYPFYAWNCVLGILLSAGAGLLVYFLIDRLLLRKDGEYFNPLPRNLSLFHMIYRPVISGIGKAAGFVDSRLIHRRKKPSGNGGGTDGEGPEDPDRKE
ncbi:MAG: NADH dehydrogenase [Clostridia bacterium]|nr:NADH dehydrogenase [Clostridia bacterium]